MTDIILLDDEERICALIPIVRLVLAEPGKALIDLPHGHIVSCNAEANGKKVADLFDKYNLRSLSVVDDDKRLLGVIHAEQVIAQLRQKH